VADVMSQYPVTTAPDADVAEVAQLMLEHDVRSIPVLDGNTIAGIISRRDILRAMVRSDDTLTKEVQHRLDEYADGAQRWTVTVHGGVATVVGEYNDDMERQVVAVLARTVPGVAAVHV
jgi:CBS domain-containing protein